MPVDKNKAPEGFYAVSGNACALCVFNGKPFCTYKEKYGKPPNCSSERRLDDCNVHFIKKESEKTMEYEYMTANTPEAWHTIIDAICRGDCEIKRSLVKPEGPRGFAISTVWDQATHLENGREYRWKKPAPPIDAERLEQECRLARERGKVVCVWMKSDDDNMYYQSSCGGDYEAMRTSRHLTALTSAPSAASQSR